MLAAGDFRQRLPGLHRHFAVGLRRQHQDHLGRVDVGLDPRHALGDALVGDGVVEFAELLHLVLGIPGDALAAVADLRHQRPQRGELLVGVRVVALDHGHRRRGLAGHQLAFAFLPFLDVERLRQLSRRVVHQRRQHQLLLHAQVADADLGELLGETLVDFPVVPRLPCRVHRRRQRVDERVHVGGVEVVLLVPGGGGQHDVRIEAGGGHAEIQGHQQVELALGRLRRASSLPPVSRRRTFPDLCPGRHASSPGGA